MNISENIRIDFRSDELPIEPIKSLNALIYATINDKTGNVTAYIKPEIKDKIDKKFKSGAKVSLTMIALKKEDWKFKLDFAESNTHKIEISNQSVEIKLMNIAEDVIDGEKIKYAEFFIYSV